MSTLVVIGLKEGADTCEDLRPPRFTLALNNSIFDALHMQNRLLLNVVA